MPQIAHFIQRYPPALGGSEAYFARLSQSLAESGHAVTVWTTSAITLEELWRPTKILSHQRSTKFTDIEVRRYRPRSIPARRYLLRAAGLWPSRMWQLLCQPCNPICPDMWRDAGRYNGPLDVVHATAFPYGFPLACGLRLARRRRVPFFLTPFLHLGDPTDPHDRTRRQYTRPHLRWLLRQADRVFVQTPSELEAALRLGVPASKLVLQGLGVEPVECAGGDRSQARAEWNISGDEVVIGHLANLSVEKGTVDLLRAAEILWHRGLKFRVVLAGPDMTNFRDFWNHYTLKQRVVRLGPLTEDQKRNFYAGIDLFALPSRTDSFGLVLLEAWANAKPVVAYRAGGPADIVRDSVDGLLVKCGDVNALAEGLRTLVESASIRASMGNSGHERVVREFRWQDSIAKVEHEINTVV